MEKPLNLTRKSFINNVPGNSQLEKKQLLFRTAFSLNKDDIEILESQIDRAIRLEKRNKSKTSIIRMALIALRDVSDEKYLELYKKF